jgi:hypothetical protein
LHRLCVAEALFGPNGLVMINDTNDPETRQATLAFIRESHN